METISLHEWGDILKAVDGHFFKLICCVFQRPHKANGEEMTKYHSDDYIKFLRSIRPDNMSEYSKQMQRCEFSLTIYFHNFTWII